MVINKLSDLQGVGESGVSVGSAGMIGAGDCGVGDSGISVTKLLARRKRVQTIAAVNLV